VPVFDSDLIPVAGVISTESFGISGLNNVRDRFKQNAGIQRHVMVSRYIDQFNSAVDHVVQFIDNIPIIDNYILIKAVFICIAGIIDRQKPLIQKITGDYQFSDIVSTLQTPQKINQQRAVLQRFGVVVINTEVNVAYYDDLVPCVARIP